MHRFPSSHSGGTFGDFSIYGVKSQHFAILKHDKGQAGVAVNERSEWGGGWWGPVVDA